MEHSSSVPPGFRFHPTEEELVGYYLNRKINSLNIDLEVIVEIDLYRIEPWDIQDRCKYGYEDQNEWYFFSYKDKKYPTGTRMNRATAGGFWKATGRDKAIFTNNRMIGMRKTLVYYKGRAPNGQKSDWIMHEYRLQTSQLAPPQEQGWVVCRAFKKPTPNQNQRLGGYNAHYNTIDYNNNYKSLSSCSELPSSSNTNHMVYPSQITPYYSPFNSQQDDHLYLINSVDTLKHSAHELSKEEIPSFSINDGPNYSQNGSLDQDLICEDEGTSVEGSCVDWKSFNELIMEPHLQSRSDYELDSQNIPSHLFTNFSDL